MTLKLPFSLLLKRLVVVSVVLLLSTRTHWCTHYFSAVDVRRFTSFSAADLRLFSAVALKLPSFDFVFPFAWFADHCASSSVDTVD